MMMIGRTATTAMAIRIEVEGIWEVSTFPARLDRALPDFKYSMFCISRFNRFWIE